MNLGAIGSADFQFTQNAYSVLVCGFGAYAELPLGVGSSLRRMRGKAPALRSVFPILALHRDDAVWRLIWITPCKPKAQLGVSCTLL
jgi:hypothetical protein